MITIQDFNTATSQKRRDMASRLKERKWKTGKRAGAVRRPARELPFTLAEFRAWAMKQIGLVTARCYYCPRFVDVLHFEPDHYMPLEHGGSIGLENLVVCCEDCNRLKGAMPPHDFIALMEFVDTLSAVGRADVTKRLRAGAMGLRLRHNIGGAKQKQKPVEIPATKPLEFF